MSAPNAPYKAEAVSVEQAARMLSVSQKTIRRLIEKGELKPIRVLRSVRIPIKQVRMIIYGPPE